MPKKGEEQADLIEQVEAYVQDITDRIEANPFLGSEGEDLAMQVASLAASQVIDDMSVLFGMQASLSNETVAALLAQQE